MSVRSAPKIEEISRAADPRKGILNAIGDISHHEVFADLVLIGTYIENEKTSGGIYRPKESLEEFEYQGKAGLVLKAGPLAYADWEDDAARGDNAQLHSWVVFHVKDAWPLQVNGTACRLVPYDKLRMRVTDPKVVY